jgi:hypothetical protein
VVYFSEGRCDGIRNGILISQLESKICYTIVLVNGYCDYVKAVVEVFSFENYFSPPLVLQETRERVKLLIQLADSLVEKGHAHASAIKHWVAAVDNRYKGFSSRMDKYR